MVGPPGAGKRPLTTAQGYSIVTREGRCNGR